MNLKITSKMTIKETIKKYPKTLFTMINLGLHCVGCPAAPDETVEEAAAVHHLDLEKFLRDLNE